MTGPDGWLANKGRMPAMMAGKRMHVRFRNGMMPKDSYPCDGKMAARWTLEDHPFDITHYKPI